MHGNDPKLVRVGREMPVTAGVGLFLVRNGWLDQLAVINIGRFTEFEENDLGIGHCLPVAADNGNRNVKRFSGPEKNSGRLECFKA